jgi:paraquat-inducible protein A
MMDVFMLGILVAVVKLSQMATILPGVSLFAFAALILVLGAAQAALNPDLVWSAVPLPRGVAAHPLSAGQDVLGCAVCDLVVARRAALRSGARLRCPRCTAVLHPRKPESLQRTWALILAAVICYLPATLLPIMTTTSLGRSQSDTILSGAMYLLTHDMWVLALIVFVASIVVPLFKILILSLLLISVGVRSAWRPRERTRLYRITETIGRWSMVDVFVVTILVALVRLGNLASVEAESGAIFFCAVVVLTMLAAMSFDPRLIWDVLDQDALSHQGQDHVRDRARGIPGPNPGPV